MVASASSSTSSRTSRISSTSEPGVSGSQRGIGRRLYGLVRLVHPFPSTLDAVVTGVVAGIATGRPDVVLRLALAMLSIQAAIGAANDMVDAPADRGAKPDKPIPAGLVTPAMAARVSGVGFTAGLLLALSVSPWAFVLALAGSLVGLAYDLRLKGTAASWLPFAVGIPLLPLFGWVGASGTAPVPILVLAALAIPAGAAIALANALPDLERDLGTGVSTAATALGRIGSWRAVAVLQAVVVAGAAGSFTIIVGGPSNHGTWTAGEATASAIGTVGLAVSCVALGGGVFLSSRPGLTARQHGWELQAIATSALAASWLGGIAVAGRF